MTLLVPLSTAPTREPKDIKVGPVTLVREEKFLSRHLSYWLSIMAPLRMIH